MASRRASAALSLALLAACGRRGPEPAAPAQAAELRRSDDPHLRACADQLDQVVDAQERLADPYLDEEVVALVRIYDRARGGPSFAGEGRACAEGTRDALAAVARRWAEQGAESAGERSHGLARRAFAALQRRFPAAADEPRLRHAMGRLERARADRLLVELGEPTLTADTYRLAAEHQRRALAGGLPPELAGAAAREQLAAIRRAQDDRAPRWELSEQTCLPDPRGRCLDPTPRPAPASYSPADAERIAADEAVLAEPALRGTPEADAAQLERAALLMQYRRFDAVEAGLREVMRRRDGTAEGAEAARLLLGLQLARWMDAAGASDRSAARQALIDLTLAIERMDLALVATPAGEELRTRGPALRRAARWAEADEAEAIANFGRCGQVLGDMYGELAGDLPAQAEVADRAGRCHARAGQTQRAIAWLQRLADDHRESPRALDATLELARLHERVLDDGPARDRYLDFLTRAPRDRRAAEARRRSLLLALRTGTLPEGQLEALTRGRPEERSLAAALRFRATVRPRAAAAAIEVYIERFGKEGGARRLAIAHALAAADLLRASCPAGVAGLCAQIGLGKALARGLPRDARLLARARAHLERARQQLPAAAREEAETLEAPLAVDAEEVRAAGRLCALMLGDLRAEAALATQPPASLDPERSRAWLAVRGAEVEQMSRVYEEAGADDPAERDGAAALVEGRKAQVFESDTAQLAEVAAAVEAGGDTSLAAQMRALARHRRDAAFTAYTRCLERIAAWGHDRDGQAALCRAGLGRMVGRYEEPLEYAPDADGRVHTRSEGHVSQDRSSGAGSGG